MSLELESLYLEPSLQPTWYRKKGFGDLQVVADESARGTFFLLSKIMSGLGCPAIGKADRSQTSDDDSRVFRTFLCTSDGGSDQARFKKLCATLVEHDEMTLFISFSCLMHCAQLIVKTGLLVVDGWLKHHTGGGDKKPLKYFSTIAKIAYTWRDYTKAVYKIWTSKIGEVSAITHCKTIIPKCVAGRWGSIGDVETYLLARGVGNIITVLPEAFGIKTRRETAGAPQKASATGPGQLPLEDILHTSVVEEGGPGWLRAASVGLTV